MKKTVFTLDAGILPSRNAPVAAKISEFIEQHSENCEIVIAAGEYFLEKKIALKNLKNIDIVAYDVKFITAYNAKCGYESKGAFSFTKCQDCNIYGMAFATESPANITGRVVAIDLENRTFDCRVFDDYHVNGDEIIHGLDTSYENLSNDHNMAMADENQRKYEKIGDQLLRFYIHPNNMDALCSIHTDELICLRHTLYAAPPFNFYSCDRFLLEDITVETSPGICCGIYPRSSDFTFRRFNIRLPNGSKQIYSCCADGIHLKGLTGTLIIEDCNFMNLGDDALNIHNKAGTVYTFENNVIKVGIKVPSDSFDALPPELLQDEWAIPGDIVYMYDEENIEKVGQFKVEKFETANGYNVITVSNVQGEIKPGLKLANSAYYASVIVRNCTVSATRARALLIQSENVLIENNCFKNISGPAILLACDVKYWNEMGPSKNVTIRNNTFISTAISQRPRTAGGIVVAESHDTGYADYVERKKVHHNITITGNRFVNLKDSAIYLDAVDGVSITDNEMINCCYKNENRPDEYNYVTVLSNCENVTYQNNRLINCKVEELSSK